MLSVGFFVLCSKYISWLNFVFNLLPWFRVQRNFYLSQQTYRRTLDGGVDRRHGLLQHHRPRTGPQPPVLGRRRDTPLRSILPISRILWTEYQLNEPDKHIPAMLGPGAVHMFLVHLHQGKQLTLSQCYPPPPLLLGRNYWRFWNNPLAMLMSINIHIC